MPAAEAVSNRRGSLGNVASTARVSSVIRLCIRLLAALTLMGATAQAADLTGIPRIVDGDTLAIGATKIRLEGIDAPETDQVCLNGSGSRWACGIEARDRLVAHVAGREISCTSDGIDVYNRTLARCSLAGEDLNNWMVQEGWALAYVRYSMVYVQAEADPRTHQRGVAGRIHCALGLAASKQ